MANAQENYVAVRSPTQVGDKYHTSRPFWGNLRSQAPDFVLMMIILMQSNMLDNGVAAKTFPHRLP